MFKIVNLKKTNYRKKLLALGFTPNTEFDIIRIAPMGDPIEIKIRGFLVSIRKKELDSIEYVNLGCGDCKKCTT